MGTKREQFQERPILGATYYSHILLTRRDTTLMSTQLRKKGQRDFLWSDLDNSGCILTGKIWRVFLGTVWKTENVFKRVVLHVLQRMLCRVPPKSDWDAVKCMRCILVRCIFMVSCWVRNVCFTALYGVIGKRECSVATSGPFRFIPKHSGTVLCGVCGEMVHEWKSLFKRSVWSA